jgi:hypothetical protein
MLICLVDRSADYGDVHAGDVIAAMPDGWPWSALERSNPNWSLISSPITQSEADALQGTDLPVPPPAASPPLRWRRYRVDTTGMVGASSMAMDAGAFRSRMALK